MGMLDKLASAETSSDLRHYPEPCAIDVLAAAGMAGVAAPIHLALFRLKYLDDREQIEACKAIFTRWTYRAMVNRGIMPQSASRVGVQTLTAWVHDTCTECAGQKYRVIEGTPALSVKACSKCHGLGKNPIGDGQIGEVKKDVIERADDAINGISGRILDKLR